MRRGIIEAHRGHDMYQGISVYHATAHRRARRRRLDSSLSIGAKTCLPGHPVSSPGHVRRQRQAGEGNERRDWVEDGGRRSRATLTLHRHWIWTLTAIGWIRGADEYPISVAVHTDEGEGEREERLIQPTATFADKRRAQRDLDCQDIGPALLLLKESNPGDYGRI